MAEKKSIRTKDAPDPGGAYSQGVTFGGFLFVAGQLPKDPATNKLVEGDFEAQAVQVFENIDAILRAGGSDPSRVVKATVYLADLSDFDAMDRLFRLYFPGVAPARTTIGAALRYGARIVADAIAAL